MLPKVTGDVQLARCGVSLVNWGKALRGEMFYRNQALCSRTRQRSGSTLSNLGSIMGPLLIPLHTHTEVKFL